MGLVSFVDKNKDDFPEEYPLNIKYVKLSNPQFNALLDKLIISNTVLILILFKLL